jgi:flagellar motor switch protein FliN/FliY
MDQEQGEASAKRAAGGEAAARGGLGFVSDVPLRLTVELGQARLLVREVLQLDKGSVVELDRMSGEPADGLVNGRLVARGELTVIDERMAVRLVEIVASPR